MIETKDWEFRRGQPSIAGFPGATPVEQFEDDTRFDGWLVQASLRYQPTEALMLYGRYANGYRSGGFNGRTAGVRARYDPEDVDSFELGVKSTWWDQRLLFNVALFYTEYSGVQRVGGPVTFDPETERLNQGTLGRLSGRVSLRLDDGRTEIAVWGRNLLDREYLSNGLPFYTGFAVGMQFYGLPRTYGIEVSRRF